MSLTEAQQRELNIRLRDRNIKAGEKDKREFGPNDQARELTKEKLERFFELRKRPFEKQEKEDYPYFVLRDQKELLFEQDEELVADVNKTYLQDAGYGDGLKHRGDLGQKNLHFSNVKACPREIYYKFFEPERARKYTVKGLILFDDGDRHHINIQRRLEDQGKIQNPEGFLEIPEVEATGYYDGLVNIETKPNGDKICDLLEIKSKLPYACERISQIDYDQAQLYHYAAKYSKRLKSKRIKIRAIRIFYKDRAVQTDDVHFAYLVHPDLDRQQDILTYLRFLKNTVIDQKKLVPHPYEKDSTKCVYCLYRHWCWREFPEVVEERDDSDLDNVTLPEGEILESVAKHFYEILAQEKALRDEKRQLEPLLLKYFKETKRDTLPITESEALAPKVGKRTEWDEDGLLEALGPEWYARISSPKKSKITELINTHYVDAGTFEKFKNYKANKPSIYIKSINNGG
jgi:hypothetical protein